MFLRFLKKPARIACLLFEAFSGGFILLDLEVISFIPIISKLFFWRAGFAHYLRTFSGQWYFANPHCHQEILFDQCRLYPSLFQFSFVSILYSYRVYFPAVS